jgi:hypothetical protein
VATIPSAEGRELLWRRLPPGCEVVRIGRVWFWPARGWTVRAHPVRGGTALVADATWFTSNYAAILPGSPAGR